MAHSRNELKQIYKAAANKAFEDNIDPGNEPQLIAWIENNCSFDREYLFFLVLGIGAELADLQAQHEGYEHQVDKIWKERITPNFECNQFGVWRKKAHKEG